MSRATVLLVLAALSYGGCEVDASEPCNVTDGTATCDGEQFAFPLNLPEIITQLYIHSTKVKTISKDIFAPYNELEVIDLSNCDITEIDPDTFTGLSNLNELNLAGNKALSGEKTFISSQSLTRLNLSETGIKTIRENFLEELPNLDELDLSYASLTETEISALLKLSNLSTLIISDDYKDQLNNICGETNLRTIELKTGNDGNETYDCSDFKEKDTTTVQQEASTVPNIIGNQSESDDNGTKVQNTAVNQSKENDEATTESDKDDGITAITTIVDDNTEDKNTTVVKPPKDELEPVKTSDEDPKDNEQEEHKNETADEGHDNETPPEVLDANINTKIALTGTNNQRAKIFEPVTENVDENTSEPVTENVAGKTEEPVTENVAGKTQSDNGAEGTTTDATNVNDSDTQEFSNSNTVHSTVKPMDGSEDADNKTLGVASPAAQSSGTNVVLGIILTVMVIGAVGFGYKYWKNRRTGYRNANTEETLEDGKELQTIVTHHTDPEQN